jgi:putative sigma-54 modulation protein
MNIDIQARGFELTEGLREHTYRRLKFATDWAMDDVKTIKVRLSDINGPRGGADKHCLIQIPMAKKQQIVIHDTEADLYIAIDKAIKRAEQLLAKRIGRIKEHAHVKVHHLAYDDEETLISN